jgi:hypothetical protein
MKIGFIGVRQKRTPAQIKKEVERTVAYIKAKKSGKTIHVSKRKERSVAKAK